MGYFMQRENCEIAVILSEIVLFLQRQNCEMTVVLSKIKRFSQCENCEMTVIWSRISHFSQCEICVRHKSYKVRKLRNDSDSEQNQAIFALRKL